ncbi:MAG TPA: hypothetical protein VIS74_02745 [Chthoniobacterales bacterium]
MPSRTPEPSPSPSPVSASSTEFQDAAETSSEIARATSENAVREAGRLEGALANLAKARSDENLALSREALSTARAAYFQMESAVLFDGDEFGREAASLPEPVALPGNGEDNRFSQIESLLKSYEHPASEGLVVSRFSLERNQTVADLKIAAENLRLAMEKFSASWGKDDPANFRNAVFLSDPEAAIGQVLQGLMKTSDWIAAQAGALPAGEIAPRLRAIQSYCLGMYDDGAGRVTGRGLTALVASRSPGEAEDLASHLAGSLRDLEEGPPDPNRVRSQFLEISGRMQRAAEALGFRVESSVDDSVVTDSTSGRTPN